MNILREHHKGIFRDAKLRKHFHEGAFHGFDFDPTMLRIGSMNMILHGIENPVIEARDSLSEDIAGEKESTASSSPIRLSPDRWTMSRPPATFSRW